MSTLPLVREHMDRYVHTLAPEMNILDAVDYLLEHRVTGAPVADVDGILVGLLDEKDCLRLIAAGAGGEAPRGSVADFMVRSPRVVPPTMDIYYTAGLFLQSDQRRFPVVDEHGRLVGVITRFDVLRAVQRQLR